MEKFRIRILEADQPFYEGFCESLIVPTVDGEYGVLAHHSNTISAIVPGTMTYRLPDGEVHIAAVSAGLIKIENNEVLVLVDSAEHPDEIDIKRAQREADEAREVLLHKITTMEYRLAQATLARAINRVRVKESQLHSHNK